MRILDIFQEKTDTNLFVGPNNTIKQQFVPKNNNLAGIRLVISNPNLGGNTLYQLTIIDENNNPVREETVSESNLGWNETFRYDFPAIKDSQNKQFAFVLTYLGKNTQDADILTIINKDQIESTTHYFKPDELDKVQKSYISIAYSRTDNYKEGNAYLNNQPIAGDVAFQIYQQKSMAGFMKDTLYEFSGKIKNDSSFFALYFILVISLTFLLLLSIRKSSG